NAIAALKADLDMLEAAGWKVIPAYWAAQWVIGDRDGSTLPDKVVAITLDDGANQTFIDNYNTPCRIEGFPAGSLPSAYAVLSAFKQAHPNLPFGSPHASALVIASPVARSFFWEPQGWDDSWWWAAQNQSNNLMEVYNHSIDHDHQDINQQAYDPDPTL